MQLKHTRHAAHVAPLTVLDLPHPAARRGSTSGTCPHLHAQLPQPAALQARVATCIHGYLLPKIPRLYELSAPPCTRPSRSFADESQLSSGQRGVDRVRGYQVGKLNVKLKYFEEVFTSQHWMMRIYRVRDKPLRDSTNTKTSGKKTVAASRRS